MPAEREHLVGRLRHRCAEVDGGITVPATAGAVEGRHSDLGREPCRRRRFATIGECVREGVCERGGLGVARSWSTQPDTPCSTIEQIGLGIDRGLPIGTAGIRTYCDLNPATTAGQYFTLALWILQAPIWALATLAVADYIGLIRKIT